MKKKSPLKVLKSYGRWKKCDLMMKLTFTDTVHGLRGGGEFPVALRECFHIEQACSFQMILEFLEQWRKIIT